MKTIEKTRYALLLLCAAVTVGAAVGFTREYGVTYLLRGEEREVIAGLKAAGAETDLPLSARATRELITKCASLSLASPQLRASAADRAAFDESCAAIAKEILARNPMSPRALAASLVVEPKLTADRYAAAQQAAPFEPWPLGTRLLAAERGLPLSPDVAALVKSDIAAAFVSAWGRQLLAGIYARQESLRTLILEVAETQSAADQRSFLQMTRKQVRTDG